MLTEPITLPAYKSMFVMQKDIMEVITVAASKAVTAVVLAKVAGLSTPTTS